MLALALCLCFALPLGGCGKRSRTKHEEGVAVVVPVLTATFIRNFNPFFQTQSRWPATAGIYEPTIIFNRATGKFIPWLAEEWWWQDENRRLVLKIRQGVKWSDGKPLTSQDVAFTFQLMRKFDALDQSSIWTHLDRIETQGQNVHFHFKHPFTTPVLDMIGQQPIVPEHIWKDVDDPVRFANEDPVGSGPYNQVLSF
jgi:peptide/nickel transport system substrate-binding protein